MLKILTNAVLASSVLSQTDDSTQQDETIEIDYVAEQVTDQDATEEVIYLVVEDGEIPPEIEDFEVTETLNKKHKRRWVVRKKDKLVKWWRKKVTSKYWYRYTAWKLKRFKRKMMRRRSLMRSILVVQGALHYFHLMPLSSPLGYMAI